MAHQSSRLSVTERWVLGCIDRDLPVYEGFINYWDIVDRLIELDMVTLTDMVDEDTPITARITQKGLTALWS